MHSRLLAALVAGALTVPLLGSTVATSAPAPAPDRATDALGAAQALFAEKSPAAARRQVETTGREASMVLNELRRNMGDLSAVDRKQARALLARPTSDGGDDFVDYTAAEATPVCGATICVHYVRPRSGDIHAPPNVDTAPDNNIPDEVDRALANAEQVNTAYVTAGYRRPDPDRRRGDNNKIDVYLADVGDIGLYGYCTSDQPLKDDDTSNYWAYCVIDDDFRPAQFPTNTPAENQQVTLAHEYFHAVQYAYDANEASWFLEATATWAEDEVYDSVNDNWNYLPFGQMGEPRIPLNTFGGLVHYGNWVFFRYLTEKYRAETGGIPNLVLEVVQRGSNRTGEPDATAMQALQRELKQRGTTLSKVYAQFATANRTPRASYDEGRNYDRARPERTWTLSSSKRSTGVRVGKVKHLSNVPLRYQPGRGTTARNWKIRLRVDMQPRVTVPSARVLVFKKNGTVAVSKIRLNRRTKGSKVLSFSSRSVKYVELVLVNASPGSNQGRTRFSARIFRR